MKEAVPFLRLDGVEFDYEGARMRFDLDVEAAEWLAIIGPSGAGKSTLLDLVAGFLAPEKGRILIGGVEVTRRPPSERPISFVFQENNLFTHLDAAQNVGLGLSPTLRLDRRQRQEVATALADVGLAGFERRRPGEMSGGERQRVALARAFVRERPLLLLDEPFAALGPALRADMLRLLASRRAMRKGAAMTILMVTHHPEDARGFAGRVAFLDGGRIAAEGPTDAILSGGGDAAVSAYLGRAKED